MRVCPDCGIRPKRHGDSYCAPCRSARNRAYQLRRRSAPSTDPDERRTILIFSDNCVLPAGEMTACPRCGAEMVRRDLWRHIRESYLEGVCNNAYELAG